MKRKVLPAKRSGADALGAGSIHPKIRPVSRTTISDEIVAQILALIESGDLQPGQRLPSERELCVRFGSGRSSLREALRCLAIVGVLHARVGEGTSVAKDSGKFLQRILHWRLITERHDVENLMEVRTALEGLAAASVAVKGTDAEIARLESLIGKMTEHVDDPKRFFALDLEFHETLAKASDNALASDLILIIRGQIASGVARVLNLPNARPLSLEEHARIVERLRARDPEGARAEVNAHLNAAVRRYQRSFETEMAAGEGAPVAEVAAEPVVAKSPTAAAGGRPKRSA